jgi:dTDP-4-amino-4,6-dideoxygalactose transaminase
MIPFNKPFIVGSELEYIKDALSSGTLSGNGKYTKRCQNWFKENYDFKHCLLTTSCTDALEMAALLLDIQAGDEVIMPSFTFVSTANAFVLRGAKIIFVDSRPDHPGMDEEKIEKLINAKTKAIVTVHYAGVACNMDKIMAIAEKYNLFVVEDAAQAIDSYYTSGHGNRRPLGSIGHLAAFSFHETKNIISGEGGMLVINDERFAKRAEIIWEKGTNRSAFYRGEVDKYGWVDIGSSFLPSELISAFLNAQLEALSEIQAKRKHIWKKYQQGFDKLFGLGHLKAPHLPEYADNNAHMFYVVCNSITQRSEIIEHLRIKGIQVVFHYQSLHASSLYLKENAAVHLNLADHYSDTLLRFPLYFGLSEDDQNTIIETVLQLFPESNTI